MNDFPYEDGDDEDDPDPMLSEADLFPGLDAPIDAGRAAPYLAPALEEVAPIMLERVIDAGQRAEEARRAREGITDDQVEALRGLGIVPSTVEEDLARTRATKEVLERYAGTGDDDGTVARHLETLQQLEERQLRAVVLEYRTDLEPDHGWTDGDIVATPERLEQMAEQARARAAQFADGIPALARLERREQDLPGYVPPMLRDADVLEVEIEVDTIRWDEVSDPPRYHTGGIIRRPIRTISADLERTRRSIVVIAEGLEGVEARKAQLLRQIQVLRDLEARQLRAEALEAGSEPDGIGTLSQLGTGTESPTAVVRRSILGRAAEAISRTLEIAGRPVSRRSLEALDFRSSTIDEAVAILLETGSATARSSTFRGLLLETVRPYRSPGNS